MRYKINILVPSTKSSVIPSLGYSGISAVLKQAFPEARISVVYLDSKKAPDADVLIFNAYSAWGLIDLQRIFDDWGWNTPEKRHCKVILGGPGAYNPLPFVNLVDYISLSEESLVNLISELAKTKPKLWRHPDFIYAKTSYLLSIMPTQGCRHRCSFCELVVHYNFNFVYAPLSKIKKLLARTKAKRIQVHAASILQYPHFVELCELLKKTKAQIFIGSMNLIEIDETKALALKSLNPRHTVGVENATNDSQGYFGLESGSPRILKLMRKPLTVPIAIERVRILKKCGFSKVGFYLILGYPSSTIKDFRRTADLLNLFASILGNKSIIRIKCTPFFPSLGTLDVDKPFRKVQDYTKEYYFLRKHTKRNIIFDISLPSYYLATNILMKGTVKHHGLVEWFAQAKVNDFETDKKMSSVLKQLQLPTLKEHIRNPAPIDLSSKRSEYFNLQKLVKKL